MKHLQKFNEKKNSKIIEYIDMCFLDFLDEGAKTKQQTFGSDVLYKIKIRLREKHNNWEPNNIKEYIELGRKIEQISLDVEACINKVKIEYPDIEYSVFVSKENDKYIIVLVLKESEIVNLNKNIQDEL